MRAELNPGECSCSSRSLAMPAFDSSHCIGKKLTINSIKLSCYGFAKFNVMDYVRYIVDLLNIFLSI